MEKIPAVHLAAAALIAIYGLISLVGGTIGYVKANSMASLIAGGVSGLILLLCAAGVFRMPVVSLIVAALVALALAGRFAPKVFGASEKAAGAVDYVMTLGGAIVLIACVAAVAIGPRGTE